MKTSRFTMLFTIAALSACSGGTVKQELGLNREGPDEYRVYSRPPLSVPPEFNLRPPGTGSGPDVVPANQQAQQLLIGGATGTATKAPFATSPPAKLPTSGAESQFLKNAGADKSDPNVRNELVQQQISAQETQEAQAEDCSWWDFWCSKPKDKEPVVNAAQEQQRIKQDEAQGKPVTEGDTPVVKPKDTGLLGTLLGY